MRGMDETGNAGDPRVTTIEVNPDASGAPEAIALRMGAEVGLPFLVAGLRSERHG